MGRISAAEFTEGIDKKTRRQLSRGGLELVRNCTIRMNTKRQRCSGGQQQGVAIARRPFAARPR